MYNENVTCVSTRTHARTGAVPRNICPNKCTNRKKWCWRLIINHVSVHRDDDGDWCGGLDGSSVVSNQDLKSTWDRWGACPGHLDTGVGGRGYVCGGGALENSQNPLQEPVGRCFDLEQKKAPKRPWERLRSLQGLSRPVQTHLESLQTDSRPTGKALKIKGGGGHGGHTGGMCKLIGRIIFLGW